MKNRLLKTALLTIAISVTLSGCSGETTSFQVNDVSVSDFPFTMNTKPAVDITIKQDEHNFCSITLLRSDVKQGFHATLKQKAIGNISSSCHINGDVFMQSSKHPTMVSLSVENLDTANRQAKIKTSFKLVNIKTYNNYLEFKNVEFVVTGKQFTNLTTIPAE